MVGMNLKSYKVKSVSGPCTQRGPVGEVAYIGDDTTRATSNLEARGQPFGTHDPESGW